MTGKQNSKGFILVFLGMLSAFGPFVMDMYLPTLPAMSDFFQTTSSKVQLGLTTSMVGLAIGQLVFGPLSDKYGRRSPLLAAMGLFLISTVGCIFSRDISQFVLWRFVQGVAGAGGVVISRSIAADKYSAHELAGMLATIGAVNGIATVVAPIGGGALADFGGWHGIFWFLFALGVLLVIGSVRFKESLPIGQICITVSVPYYVTANMCVTFCNTVLQWVFCSPILLPLLLLCNNIMVFHPCCSVFASGLMRLQW